MKFPGDNEITLTESAIRELLKAQAPALFGDDDARITKIATKSYPSGLVVTFTTDPEPSVAVPDPAPSRPRASIVRAVLPETPPMATPLPSIPGSCPTIDVDDDHPF